MVYILVGIAGALGAVFRYIIGILLFTEAVFPYTTLLVNLLGCFALAFLTPLLLGKFVLPTSLVHAILSGFIGSFTTFSAFSIETIELFQIGKISLVLIYVSISVVGGFIISLVGFRLGKVVR